MSEENKTPSFEEAIQWLRGFTPEQQFTKITQLFKNQITGNETDFLIPIVAETLYLLNTNSPEEVIKQLQKHLDNDIATVLVTNAVKIRPSELIDANVLKEMELNKLVDVFNGILGGYYLKGKNIDILSQEIGIQRGSLEACRRFIASDVFANLKGNRPTEQIHERWQHFEIQEEKIKRYIEVFNENIKSIREVLIFQAVSKFMTDFDDVKASVDKIWEKIDELASELRRAQTSSDMDAIG